LHYEASVNGLEVAYEVEGLLTLEQFRRFLLNALRVGNPGHQDIFPEVEGRVLVDAMRKRVVAEEVEGAVRGVRLVEARGIRSISYRSASGRSQLRWVKVIRGLGRVKGVASPWTLRNLHSAGVNLDLLKIRRR